MALWVCGAVGRWRCGEVALWGAGSVGRWICGEVPHWLALQTGNREFAGSSPILGIDNPQWLKAVHELLRVRVISSIYVALPVH